MKKRYIIIFVSIIVTLFLLTKIKLGLNKPYYEPGKYVLTIKANLYGVVTRIVEGKNFFGVVIDNNENAIYPFTYMIEKMPNDWKKKYPEEFIQIGDTIIKKANNDTFYVVKRHHKWLYVLPNVSLK